MEVWIHWYIGCASVLTNPAESAGEDTMLCSGNTLGHTQHSACIGSHRCNAIHSSLMTQLQHGKQVVVPCTRDGTAGAGSSHVHISSPQWQPGRRPR